MANGQVDHGQSGANSLRYARHVTSVVGATWRADARNSGKAVEAFRRQTFLQEVNTEFVALRRDRKAWKQEKAERKAWEATLADGLEED